MVEEGEVVASNFTYFEIIAFVGIIIYHRNVLKQKRPQLSLKGLV